MATGKQEHQETERKYDTSPSFAFPGLAVPGAVQEAPPQLQQLRAVYFDTAGLRLAAAKITLRRRTGGCDAGWHIKLPVRPGTRRELRFPAGRAARQVPARVAEEVAEWTGGEPLGPVARLYTRRTVRRLLDPDGRVLAEVADDQVTGSRPDPAQDGGWMVADSWRELEVELVDGDAGLLERTGELLVRAGAAPSASASKLARVLGTG